MRRPRVQLRVRTLLALVTLVALASWVWVAYLSPTHCWQRAIRSDNESAERWEAANRGLRGQVPGVGRAEAIAALS